MQISYSLTESHVVDWSLYYSAHSPTVRRQRRLVVVMIVLAILCLCAHSIAWPDPDGSSGITVVTYLLLGGLLLVLQRPLWSWLLRGACRKALREGRNLGLLGPRIVTVSPEGCFQKTNYVENRYSWPAIERIEATEAYAFIYISAVNAIIVPKRALPPGEVDAFVAAAREYAAAAPPPATPPYEMTASASGRADQRR